MNPQLDPMVLVDEALNKGTIDIVHAYATIYALQVRATEALNAIKPAMVDAAAEYGKEGVTVGEYTFVKQNGKRIYSYDHISTIKDATDRLDALKLEAKKAADARERGQGYHDEVSGEIIEPAVIKFSVDTVVAQKVKPTKA